MHTCVSRGFSASGNLVVVLALAVVLLLSACDFVNATNAKPEPTIDLQSTVEALVKLELANVQHEATSEAELQSVLTPTPTQARAPTPILSLKTTPTPTLAPTPEPASTQVVRQPQIAFDSDRLENQGIYLMDATPGASLIRLIAEPDIEASEPNWTPDGKRIIFLSKELCLEVRPGGVNRTIEERIFIMDADGANVTRVTKLSDRCFSDIQPDISPDGRRIAFVSRRAGESGIFTMDISGADVRQLTHINAYVPRWSPDGSKIIFVGPDGIWVMKSDGTDQTILFKDPTLAWELTWSPDGAWIAYGTNRHSKSCLGCPEGKNTEIYVMSSDGSVHRRLTDSPARKDLFAAWSPDGSEIAFASADFSAEFTNWEIFIINADGSNLRQMTFHPADDQHPRWRP